MKALVAGIGGVFLVLLAATVYVAVVSDEGLVEDAYYDRARNYLAVKEVEASLGLAIRVPDRLAAGRSRFAAVVTTSSGPLRGAAAALHAMRLSGPGRDIRSALREESPGTYAGELALPDAGKWLMRLTVDRGPLRTERQWLATAAPAAETPGGGDAPRGRAPGRDVHAGPVAGRAGTQAVILDISPKPVRAMRELAFSVALPGRDAALGPPRVDLEMPGMRMPPNRVDLARGADGIYRGTGVIVRCGTGRRTWSAAVTLPDRTRASFAFDVAD